MSLKTDSTFANHLIEHNHTFPEEIKILHLANKLLKLDLLESLELRKAGNNSNFQVLNDQTQLKYSTLFDAL